MWVYVYTRVHVHVQVGLCVYVRRHHGCLDIHDGDLMWSGARVYVRKRECIYTWVYVYTRVHVHVGLCAYMRVHVHVRA